MLFRNREVQIDHVLQLLLASSNLLKCENSLSNSHDVRFDDLLRLRLWIL